ncbi:MAG: hypothetical protein LBM23_05000 [Propionibacteriaceae bacterium]|jgi:hypothetical protein|nr:hypothetical protein [Propionibacteriaceae bacterium]
MSDVKRRGLFALGGLVVILAVFLFFASSRSPWIEVTPDAWETIPDDPSALAISLMSGVDHDVRVDVDETPADITLTVWIRERSDGPNNSHVALGVPTTVDVRLSAPLNNRVVLDRDGRPVPQRT